MECKVFFCFLTLGLLNNFGFVMVLAAASSLSTYFHAENQFGWITWGSVAFGSVVRSLNTWFLGRVSRRTRMAVNAIVMALGLLGVAISPQIGFWFTIISIVAIGASSSFGESVLLSYIRLFPVGTVGAWSTGSGLAGVIGSGGYLVFSQLANLSDSTLFFSISPVALVYFLCFLLVVGEESSFRKLPSTIEFSDVTVNRELEVDTVDNSIEILDSDFQSPNIFENEFQRSCRVGRQISFYCGNMAFTYMFDYMVSGGLANNANSNMTLKDSIVIYSRLQFCYQGGVLLARSSLPVLRVHRIGVITILQFINVCIWLVQDLSAFMPPSLQYCMMVYAGALGGLSYVNIFNLILTSETVDNSDKELAVNLAALSINLGIVISAVLILIFNNTFLPKTNIPE